MKLFSIVKTFDKKQLSGFLTYIQLDHKPKSVVCTVAQGLDLEKIMKSQYDEEPTGDELFEAFPQSIKRQSFLNALTRLGNIAEEYLGWMNWRENEYMRKSCQLSGLAKEGLHDEYLKTKKTIFEKDPNDKITVWNDFYKLKAVFEVYYYQISDSEEKYFKEEFNELIETFKIFSSKIAQILLVEIKSRERLLSEPLNYKYSFLDILYKNETKLKNITDNLILLNTEQGSVKFNNLKKVLYSKGLRHYSQFVVYLITTYIRMFLKAKIKAGELSYTEELFNIYDYCFDNQVYTLNEKINFFKLMNLIDFARSYNKFEWAKKIINDYSKVANKYNAQIILKHGNAHLDFYLGHYESVISVLSTIKATSFVHKYQLRWLILKTLYELNKENKEIVKVHIYNIRRFIDSNRLKFQKPVYVGIITSLKILKMIVENKPKDKILAFESSCKYVYNKSWMIKKIMEDTI